MTGSPVQVKTTRILLIDILFYTTMEKWVKNDTTGEWEKITTFIEQTTENEKKRKKTTRFFHLGETPLKDGDELEITIPSLEDIRMWSTPTYSSGNFMRIPELPPSHMVPLSPCPRIISPIKGDKTDQEATRDFLAECKRQQKKKINK